MKTKHHIYIIVFFLIAISLVQMSDPKDLTQAWARIQKLERSVKSLGDSLARNRTRTQEQTNNLNRAVYLNALPWGTIVAYALEKRNIPDGWVLCDGKSVTDSMSPLFRMNTPNLISRFIRGKSSTENIGDQGGTNTIAGHFHTIKPHSHEVGSHTHNFVTEESSITGARYCTDPNCGVQCFAGNPNTQYFLASSNESSYESLTKHAHSGTTGNASSGYVSRGGESETGISQEETNIPGYVALNYIIKIR